MSTDPLTPEHEGYKKLKSFQIARLIHDVTVRFCKRYIDLRSQNHDKMVLAARSGVQNIAEASKPLAASTTAELKLNRAARASLEELRLYYEEFLRQHNLPVWLYDDRRRRSLINRKCSTVDEVVLWVLQEHKRQLNRQNPSGSSTRAMPSAQASLPEISANASITLTVVACGLLDRQIATLAKHFGS